MIHVSQKDISAWLDGHLEAARAASVEAHLQQCVQCRSFKEELASNDITFCSLEAPQLPPHLWTRIAADLERSPNRQKFGWLRWQSYWFFGRRELAGAAALVLIIVGGVALFVHHRAEVRSEMAVVAQLDSVHNALVARNPELYNPFRTFSRSDADFNPFTRRRLDADSNPFGPLRGKR